MIAQAILQTLKDGVKEAREMLEADRMDAMGGF